MRWHLFPYLVSSLLLTLASGCLLQRVPNALCNNAVRDGTETDVDCGGACSPCRNELVCRVVEDCVSGVCVASRCIPPSCSDEVNNGTETGVDCGGDCEPCRVSQPCQVGTDCISGVCAMDRCTASSCDDGVLNEGEVDVDCGGDRCPRCEGGRACGEALDCASRICTGGVCSTASCTDMTQNQDESDADCGGSSCPRCGSGGACSNATDCLSLVCTAGSCVLDSCSDGVRNGTESDVDCGGADCDACPDSGTCDEASDCLSQVCSGGICQAPSCSDGVRNGTESDVDCGGDDCDACPDLRRCGDPTDCASGACTSGYCGNCVPFGAPDTFGYVGCTFMGAGSACPDISAAPALAIPMTAEGDDAEVTVPFGFDFPFYGDTHTMARIGMNGAIVLDGMEVEYMNACFPATAAPFQVIAPFWDDLNPMRGGNIRTATMGTAPDRELVVRWNAFHYDYRDTGGMMLDVTAVLSESGDIRFCYANTTLGGAMQDAGASATVGISHSSTEYLSYSCNVGMVTSGSVVLFSRPAP